MTTKNIEESSSEPVKFKTWVLKVSIHCEGCKKKVIKLLTSVEGVYKLDVDLKQQSVMVTGNVESDILINKLVKSGRNAELWCQILNHKKSGNEKKTVELPTGGEKEKPEKGENPATAERSGAGGDVVPASDITAVAAGGEMEAVKEKNKSEVGSECNPPAVATDGSSRSESGEGKVGKKKKKKGQNGNCINNINNNLLGEQKREVESSVDAGPQNNTVTPVRANNVPPRQHLENPPVYVVSYNMASSASTSYTTSYYTSPTPHEYRNQVATPPSDQEGYTRQPLDSFEMFSDENPNGCSIM